MADYELDAQFLLCPLPVLKAQKKLKSMVAGDTLTVTGTSKGGIDEFRLFCDTTNCKIVHSKVQNDAWLVCLAVE